jgi:putative flavoprotein involved in K+ transport
MVMQFADDLHENITGADNACRQFLAGAGKFAAASGIALPEEELQIPSDAFASKPILELDLVETGISTIIWATGYRVDFGWIAFPIFDEFGHPIQQRGVTAQPGLYFVGLHFMSKRKSALLAGVAEDAEYVVEQIAGHQVGAV